MAKEPKYKLSRFGADPSGTNSSTAAIQKAFNWSSTTGEDLYDDGIGAVYKIDYAQSQYGVRMALYAQSNLSYDGSRSFLRMAAGQNHCSAIQIYDLQAYTTPFERIKLKLRLDANCQNQTITPGGTPSPSLYFNNIKNCEFDLDLYNTIYAGFYASSDSHAHAIQYMTDNKINARLDTCIGGGIQLYGARYISDRIVVLNCAYNDNNSQGNPIIYDVEDSIFTTTFCQNFGFGPKLQGDTQNVQFGNVTVIGGVNNFLVNEFGFKIQGNTGHILKKIQIGSLKIRNIPKTALYCTNAIEVQISNYEGSGNSSVTDVADANRTETAILNGSDVHIGNYMAEDFSFKNIHLDNKDSKLHINNMIARTSKTTLETGWGHNLLSGRYTVDHAEFVNTSGVAKIIGYTDYSSAVTPANSVWDIKDADIDVDVSIYFGASPVSFFKAANAGESGTVHTLNLKGYSNHFPNVALTAGAGSTTVANAKAFCANGSDFGCYVIAIAINTNAIAIAGVGGTFLAKPVAMASGGGFTIVHANVASPGNAAVFVHKYVTNYAGPI